MTGSGDVEGFEDIMAATGMTLLEAVLYTALDSSDYIVGGQEHTADAARRVAKFLMEHLPATVEAPAEGGLRAEGGKIVPQAQPAHDRDIAGSMIARLCVHMEDCGMDREAIVGALLDIHMTSSKQETVN